MAREVKSQFPVFGDWRGTRETLHAYCKVASAIRAALTPEQPRHGHLGLRVYTSGLTTTPISFPEDPAQTFALSLDLRNHYFILSTSGGHVQQLRLSEGLSATQLGNELLARLAELGVQGKVPAKSYSSDVKRDYALDEAERFLAALRLANQVFEDARKELGQASDAVQLWPRLFDLSFVAPANDEDKSITFGLALQPGNEYFYVSPHPFDKALTQQSLPNGARWNTDGWKGAMLPYSEVAGKADGAERVLAFLRAAYALQLPTL